MILNMTIIFSGNDYKYEIEAIVKLFFPATSFDFLYNEVNGEGDIFIIRRKVGKKFSYLYAYARLGDKFKRLAEKCENSTRNYENFCEQSLCKLLFLCLKELTGITPAWGTLTGIRPVKRVNLMIDEGKSKEEIFNQLNEKFFVTNEKMELAYHTAITQRPFLKTSQSSFSLYVSIPFCPTRCSYCSFVSHSIESAKKLMPDYIKKLCEEIKITAEIAQKLNLTLDTIYFGGGTPTSVEAGQLDEIMCAVSDSFNLSKLREYTVEAGRADTITAEKLAVIKQNKATRISINPQTMSNSVLKAIGRNHTAEQTIAAYDLARSLGFDNINMDLIAGLPTDNVTGFMQTVDEIIHLNPENITVHTLSLKRSSTLFQDCDEVKKNPVGEMVSYAGKRLVESGYNPYYLYRQKNTLGNLENVGYAKSGFESLYNIYIMEEMQTILAVGAAASTKLVNTDISDIRRIYNYKFPYEYIDRFDQLMQKKTEIFDFYKCSEANNI